MSSRAFRRLSEERELEIRKEKNPRHNSWKSLAEQLIFLVITQLNCTRICMLTICKNRIQKSQKKARRKLLEQQDLGQSELELTSSEREESGEESDASTEDD